MPASCARPERTRAAQVNGAKSEIKMEADLAKEYALSCLLWMCSIISHVFIVMIMVTFNDSQTLHIRSDV